MSRWIRRFLLTLFVLIGIGAANSARAAGPTGAGPEIGAMPAEAKGPALLAPHDVPVMVSTAKEQIPPVPASYVTKDVGGWLELSYPPSAGERVASIIADADNVRAALSSSLGQNILGHVTVRVAPTVADMARLGPSDAPPPEYASGVAYHGLHLVLLSMMAPRGAEAVDLDEVFRHELAHVALEDAVQGRHMPVWFNEGLAISLSGELAMARTKTLWSATLSGTLLPLADLDRSFPHDNFEVSIAYAESADFMRYLTRRSDQLRFAAMIGRIREGESFERAIANAYGADLRRMELEWRSDLEHRFSVIPVLTGGGLIWVAVIGALVLAYVRRRRRTKAILSRWEREEAIEDAMVAKQRELEVVNAIPIPLSIAKTSAVSIKVEHHGRWHTLH